MKIHSVIQFKGHHKSHKKFIRIELTELHDVWRVASFESEQNLPRFILQYEGNSQAEAENVLMYGFYHHFTEGYKLDCKTEEAKTEAYLMFHRMIEALYMRMLQELDYDSSGTWKMESVFVGDEDRSIDEVTINMKRIRFPERFTWQD